MATSASLQLRHFWLACTSTRETPRAIAKALSLSKEVIDSHLYELATDVTTYKQVWSEASSREMIFIDRELDSKTGSRP